MNIPKQNIICVDYFDTSVYRDISEIELKRIWGAELSAKLGFIIPAEDITKIRLMIERNFSDTEKGAYYKYEYLIELLYDKLVSLFSNIKISKDAFILLCKKIEEEIEINHQHINSEIINMLRDAKKNNHYIILISDFYLGADSFIHFFDALKISDCFDNIFISCDYSQSKSDGSLYRTVIREVEKSFNHSVFDDSIMIGDKYKSDFMNSRNNGIKTSVHYKKLSKKDSYSIFKKYSNVFYQNSIFSNYAFSFFLFCDKLYEYCIKNDVEKLFFFSREGKYLKKLFDKFIENKKHINTEYLYVSRNATFLPSLDNLENESFSRLFNQYKKISIGTFLQSLHFSDSEIKKIGLDDINKEYDDLRNEEIYTKLLSSNIFRSLYEKKRNNAKRNFEGYLNKYGIEHGKSIYIVDVGWKGTMQDNLWHSFNGDLSISGLYLGYSREGEKNKNSIKKGILFDYVNYKGCRDISSDIFAFNSFLYEMILVADHGRTENYTEAFEPILKEDDDIIMYEKYAKYIQKDIFDKFSYLCTLKGDRMLDKTEISYFEMFHGKMFKKLSIKDANYLDNLIMLHKDGFGNKKSGAAFGNKFFRILKIKFRPYLRMKGFYNYKNGIEKW